MSKRLIIMLIAIFAAGGAGFMAMNLTAPPPAQVTEVAPAPQIELDEVLIANSTLSTGSSVEGQLRWQEWPSAAVGPDFITRSSRPEALNELSNSVVRSTIAQGEPVRLVKLLGADQSFMSSILPPGKRAVATEIAADTSAGGFILPDDFVDVIMSSRTVSGQEEGIITETILENIRVLAIDQTIREDEEGRLVQVGRTATLELTPRQAEIITAAQQVADRLTLALRSVQDASAEEGKSADHLINGGGRGTTITVIKSGQSETVNSQ